MDNQKPNHDKQHAADEKVHTQKRGADLREEMIHSEAKGEEVRQKINGGDARKPDIDKSQNH